MHTELENEYVIGIQYSILWNGVFVSMRTEFHVLDLRSALVLILVLSLGKLSPAVLKT